MLNTRHFIRVSVQRPTNLVLDTCPHWYSASGTRVRKADGNYKKASYALKRQAQPFTRHRYLKKNQNTVNIQAPFVPVNKYVSTATAFELVLNFRASLSQGSADYLLCPSYCYDNVAVEIKLLYIQKNRAPLTLKYMSDYLPPHLFYNLTALL